MWSSISRIVLIVVVIVGGAGSCLDCDGGEGDVPNVDFVGVTCRS